MQNEKSNILFLVIDSFRADRCIGKKKSSITPNLDSLIKDGIYFEQAISSSDGTAFSMESIFSSLYPFQTKIENDVLFRLHSFPSYIKDLRENGYHTQSIDLELSKMIGLTRDFEYIISLPHISSLYDGVGQQILEHFDTLKKPWMYYVHLQDLHSPYKVPSQFNNEKYGNDQYDRIVSGIDSWLGKLLEKINLKETLIVITADHGEYVPTIFRKNKCITVESTSFTNSQVAIGNLIPEKLFPLKVKLRVIVDKFRNKMKLWKVRKLALMPHEKRAITLIRANPDRSGYLYDDLVHVPLIMSGGPISTHKIISQQVRHVDIFPTIFDILALPPRKTLIHGQSVFPLIKGKDLDEQPAYLESSVTMRKGSGEVVGIRSSKYKYFKHTHKKSGTPMLFDLQNDPLEEHNIYHSKPEIVEKMEKIISELKSDKNEKTDSTSISKEEKDKIEQELRKLGYI